MSPSYLKTLHIPGPGMPVLAKTVDLHFTTDRLGLSGLPAGFLAAPVAAAGLFAIGAADAGRFLAEPASAPDVLSINGGLAGGFATAAFAVAFAAAFDFAFAAAFTLLAFALDSAPADFAAIAACTAAMAEATVLGVSVVGAALTGAFAGVPSVPEPTSSLLRPRCMDGP